jgi:hypothetical protein
MKNETLNTLLGVGLVAIGAIVIFYVAKATLVFLLNHWALVLVFLLIVVGFALYYLLRTE